MSDLAAAYKKMKVQELRDACEEKGLDSTGLKAALLERLEAWLAGSGEAPAATAAADDEEEELEDIPDDDADAADGDLVDPDAAPADAADDAAADAAAEAEADAPVEPAKTDEEVAADRAAVVAAVEADIEKRKARAQRFGLPFTLTELDNKRLECAKAGKPMPGSKQGHWARECRQPGGGGHAAANANAKGGKGGGKGGNGGRDGGQRVSESASQPRDKGGAKRTAEVQLACQRLYSEEAAEFEKKKKARAERFGTGDMLKKLDPEFEAKLAARAARFAENKL